MLTFVAHLLAYFSHIMKHALVSSIVLSIVSSIRKKSKATLGLLYQRVWVLGSNPLFMLRMHFASPKHSLSQGTSFLNSLALVFRVLEGKSIHVWLITALLFRMHILFYFCCALLCSECSVKTSRDTETNIPSNLFRCFQVCKWSSMSFRKQQNYILALFLPFTTGNCTFGQKSTLIYFKSFFMQIRESSELYRMTRLQVLCNFSGSSGILFCSESMPQYLKETPKASDNYCNKRRWHFMKMSQPRQWSHYYNLLSNFLCLRYFNVIFIIDSTHLWRHLHILMSFPWLL